MFLVKHIAPKVIIAVNCCGRQLVRRLEWSATAYHKNVGATPHSGGCKRSLQYDGRHDGRFVVLVGTYNVGRLREN